MIGHDLLLKLLEPNPALRRNAHQALMHPYFATLHFAKQACGLQSRENIISTIAGNIRAKLDILQSCMFANPRLLHIIMNYDDCQALDLKTDHEIRMQLVRIEYARNKGQQAELVAQLVMFLFFTNVLVLMQDREFYRTLLNRMQEFLHCADIVYTRDWMEFLVERLKPNLSEL